jgi:hypothetical protein
MSDRIRGMDGYLPDHAVCLGCGYPLRGLSEHRCPECGRGFDPQDEHSYRTRRWQIFAATPRWWHILGISLCTVLALTESARVPGGVFPSVLEISGVCFVFVAVIALLGDYALRIHHCIRTRRYLPARGKRHVPWRWVVTPVCVVILFSLGARPPSWPFRVRFALSRSAFERVEECFLAGELQNAGPQRIGLFHVEKIVELERGVPAFQVGTDWVDYIGFVHRTEPPSYGRAHWYLGNSWHLEWW